jgi:hypothetical protein
VRGLRCMSPGEVSGVLDYTEDERLMEALRDALESQRAVPAWFTETGKRVFAWHNVDAELAQLTHDSGGGRRDALAVRSEPASMRALTFTSAHLSMQIEVNGDSLLGEVIPGRAGILEIHTEAGPVMTTEVNEIGCFEVDSVPVAPFRLRYRAPDGTDVTTSWITL